MLQQSHFTTLPPWKTNLHVITKCSISMWNHQLPTAYLRFKLSSSCLTTFFMVRVRVRQTNNSFKVVHILWLLFTFYKVTNHSRDGSFKLLLCFCSIQTTECEIPHMQEPAFSLCSCFNLMCVVDLFTVLFCFDVYLFHHYFVTAVKLEHIWTQLPNLW